MDVIRYATEVLIDGTAVAIASEPSISMDIDTFGWVVEFQLASRPDPFPEEGTPVVVNRVKLSDNTYHTLFGGYVGGGTDVDSEPWDLRFRALDELSKFSALRTTNDLDLTGMTDGEAWKVIADVCDVTYDDADIIDTGYVLGERSPVYWKKETTGQSVIEELDRVFQTKTMTIENNRVIRFAYDRVAHSADIFTSYSKATSNEFLGNKLNRGDTTQVQSLWTVQGVSAECGTDNQCTCMVWASSTDVTPVRGKKIRRTPISQFPQSDIIQDENLARKISQRMMRWYNRVPKIHNLTVVTHANMYPGMVIGIYDPTYGIDHSSTVPAFVATVEKVGSSMNLTCIAGTGGSQGTTTSGVEKRCNKTNTDLDWEGDWDTPSLDFPDLPDFAPWLGDFDFGLISYGGTEDSMCNSLLGSAWTNDNDVWGPPEAGSYAFPGNIVGTVNPISGPYTGWGIEMFADAGVATDENWIIHIAGTHTLNNGMIALQLIDNTGGTSFVQSVSFQIGAPGIDESSSFDTESDSTVPGATLDTGAFEFIIEKSGDNFEATYKGDGGVVLSNDTLESADWNANASGANLQIGIVSWTEGTGGSVLLSTIEVCPGEEIGFGTPEDIEWEDDPEWPHDFTISGNDLTDSVGINAVALSVTTVPTHASGLPKSFELTYIWHYEVVSGGGIEMIAEDTADRDNVFFWQPFFDFSPGCYFMTGATYNSVATDDAVDMGDTSSGDTSTMVIQWDRPTKTFTVTRDGIGGTTIATDVIIGGELMFVVINGGGGSTAYCHDAVLTIQEA